jgi:hypothetical protein
MLRPILTTPFTVLFVTMAAVLPIFNNKVTVEACGELDRAGARKLTTCQVSTTDTLTTDSRAVQ